MSATVPESTDENLAVAPPEASAACEPIATTLDVAGREVLIRAPPSPQGLPVVIAIHGYKGTPAGMEQESELTGGGDAVNAIVAYPAGSPLDLGYGWNSGAVRFATTQPDDVAVLEALLDRLLELPCADPTAVTIIGESNGGGMALRAVCDQRFAGRVSGLVLVNAAVDDGVLGACAHVSSSVDLAMIAGKLDTVVGFDGDHPPFLAVADSFARSSRFVAGCDPVEPTSTRLTESVVAIQGVGCASCAVLIVVDDGPHTWPGRAAGVGSMIPGSFALTDRLTAAIEDRQGFC